MYASPWVLLALLLLLPCASDAAWSLPARMPLSRLLPPGGRGAARARARLQSWGPAPAPPAGSRVFSPLAHGGDPTGLTDSTAALQATVADLLAACGERRLADWVRDCGGAVLDLQGGEYLVSAPLAIPPGYGNLHVMQGSLLASAAFPALRALIEVGNMTASGAGSNIDVQLSGLFLDAAHVAAGCIHTDNLQGGVIGPQVYLLGFTETGARVTKGFEVTIMQAWAAEFWFGDPRKENGNATGNTTGIFKEGNDGVVTDCVIFSSRVGLWIAGEANDVDAIHTWNLANGNGGIGILSTAPQTRFTECYLDWNDFVSTFPQQLTFTGGFFLCGGRIRIVAPADGVVTGVYLAGNEFTASYCHFTGYSGVQADGNFSRVTDVTIQGTLTEPASGIGARNTRATLSATALVPTSSFLLNFSNALLFDPLAVPIQSVVATLSLDSLAQAPVAVVARTPEGALVRVDTAAPVTGTVTVTVDQSRRSSAGA